MVVVLQHLVEVEQAVEILKVATVQKFVLLVLIVLVVGFVEVVKVVGMVAVAEAWEFIVYRRPYLFSSPPNSTPAPRAESSASSPCQIPLLPSVETVINSLVGDADNTSPADRSCG